jgi:hypothetical protein
MIKKPWQPLWLLTMISITAILPSAVVSEAPPVTEGLIAHYNVRSWTGSQWSDLSGSGNHVTEIQGTPISVAQPFGSPPYLYGASTASMKFPVGILPSANYTLFFVMRYNGAARNRLLNGLSQNWLSGFCAGKSGIAYHGNMDSCKWITQSTTDVHGNDWVVGTDVSNSFRSNGVDRTIQSRECSNFDRLTINAGAGAGATSDPPSDFAVQFMLVYNRSLAAAEVLRVEAWLSAASLGPWSTAALSVARGYGAATSLPNLGLAIFAGGCTSCDLNLSSCLDFFMAICAWKHCDVLIML